MKLNYDSLCWALNSVVSSGTCLASLQLACFWAKGIQQACESGQCKSTLFLHGYGRYVCREAQVTLIEFDEITEKIRARERTKHSNQKPKHQTPNKQPNPNPKRTKTGSYLIRIVKNEVNTNNGG